ncbi:MAG: putative transporter [Tannerellaceae bacterium]|jgi:putative transport protein|nr:putative transporter [Tannerellaceae bacterium]
MYLQDLFTIQSVASTVLYLCVTTFTGVALGKLGIKGVKPGVAGVLFSGILIAHCGAPVDEHILHFVRDFGLILFVYSIGLNMGPRFFSSFKKDGLLLNLFAIGIVMGGFGIACLIYYLTGLSPAVIAEILCGAVTNTPSLGAAQQTLAEQGMPVSTVSETGMAYAVAYPLGIVGIIIAMLLIRLIFRIKVDSEVKDYTESLGGTETKLQSVKIIVTNPGLFNKTINYVKHIMDKELAISRIIRDGESIIATNDVIVRQGDIICGVSAQNQIKIVAFKTGGKVEIVETPEDISGPLTMKNVLLTNQKLAGKTIEQIGIHRRYSANITRIFRSGMKILPTLETTLELGDTIRVIGKKEILNDIKKELGDSVNELAKPNIISIFFGIFVGIILGSIPIFIPGLPAPAKLGLAGGPLLIAILLGYKGRVCKLNFYMTPGANLFMRELGIILFLSCVGLLSGKNFVETIQNGGWQWILYGVAITFIPIIIVAVIARMWKVNYLKICGCIAGAMTDPPALEFANSIAPAQAQATAYAMVYPFTMFLRVLLAQMFVLMFI